MEELPDVRADNAAETKKRLLPETNDKEEKKKVLFSIDMLDVFAGAADLRELNELRREFTDAAAKIGCKTDFQAYIKHDLRKAEKRIRAEERQKRLAERESIAATGSVPSFIVTKEDNRGNITYAVSPTKLADYIRSGEHFFFLSGEKPVAYWYDKERRLYIQCSDSEFKGYIKKPIERFDKGCVHSRDLNEVYTLLVTDNDRRRTAEELNGREELINFKNGILNLDTLELLPHSPEVLSTIQIPCDWNPKAERYERFHSFLDSLTSGNRQEQVLLLQLIGLAISNVHGYRIKKALILYGKGNTGKSKVFELVQRLIGMENTASIELRELEERFGTATLYQKRLAGSPDMSAMRIGELKLLKKLTGGDPIDIEFKGKDRITSRYNGVLIFCTNQLPRFGGDKGAHVYERFILIECGNVIPAEQRDPMLIEKLMEEREAIVYNAVMALRVLKQRNFKLDLPESCAENLEHYKTENDNVRQFLEECACERPEGCAVRKDPCTTANVYRVYKNWAKEAEEYTYSKKEFNEAVAAVYEKTGKVISIHEGKRYYPFTIKPDYRKYMGCECGNYPFAEKNTPNAP